MKEILYKLKSNNYPFGIATIDIEKLLDSITNLQKENERLKQNQVKALNRIKDFINSSKCEITEGYYSNDKHSQYWKMFKKFAEELQDKIKGIDTKDYVFIPKWREQELLNQEEQLDYYQQIIEKAIEYINENKHLSMFADCREPEEDWNYDLEINPRELLNILKGDKDE